MFRICSVLHAGLIGAWGTAPVFCVLSLIERESSFERRRMLGYRTAMRLPRAQGLLSGTLPKGVVSAVPLWRPSLGPSITIRALSTSKPDKGTTVAVMSVHESRVRVGCVDGLDARLRMAGRPLASRAWCHRARPADVRDAHRAGARGTPAQRHSSSHRPHVC